jgi:ATP synthase subunit 6
MQDRILPTLPVETSFGLFQYGTVFWSGVAVVLVAVLGWWLGRRLKKFPGRRQVFAELLVGWFDRLCKDILGERRGRTYLPLFGSLFLFVVVCNVIGLVPLSGLSLGLFPRSGLELGGDPFRDFNGDGAWQPGEPAASPEGDTLWGEERRMGFLVPSIESPTANVNVPLGLSFFLAAAMYGAAVVLRGFRGFLRSFAEPLWFMTPLNVVSAGAQVVSVSFRLFGNIFGGTVIMIVGLAVLYRLLWPVLNVAAASIADVIMVSFLGLFIGIVQAFVFTMLWLTYHADLVAETPEESAAATREA